MIILPEEKPDGSERASMRTAETFGKVSPVPPAE
jgi:hypothetical protein